MVSCLQTQSASSGQTSRSQHRRVDLMVGLEETYQSFSNQQAWVRAEDDRTPTFSIPDATAGPANAVIPAELLAMQELLEILDDRLEQVI